MNKIAFRLCFVAVLLAVLVVVLGAFTRLVDAGLGCPDWPTCYGHFWVPTTPGDVANANLSFADTPVEHDKTWPEQLHRIFASSLGMLILALLYFCVRGRDIDPRWPSVIGTLALLVAATVARMFVGDALDPYLWIVLGVYFLNLARLASRSSSQNLAHAPLQASGTSEPFKLPAFIAGLVILQGLFGMWTVTLYLWPQVVTAHLLGGFTTLTLLWLLLQRLGHWRWQADAAFVVAFMKLKPLALMALVIVALQIALGGWVSSNYAALACPDFPLCQNLLWPHPDFSAGFNVFQDIGPNYLGGLLENDARIAIHFSHRLGAIAVTIILGLLVLRLWQSGFERAKNFALVLAAVLLVQLSLGVMNIVLSLPLSVAVAHNAVGAVLLMTVATINHRIRTVTTL